MAKKSQKNSKKNSSLNKKGQKEKDRADYYDDPSHNYLHYWDGREYENAAEEMAIRRLLKGRHFNHAADIGGGYGRLCLLLAEYADEVTLAEPSKQQLEIAKEFLKNHPNIKQKLIKSASNMEFKDKSIDLITMIRVMHHLPDPGPEFKEISRILSDDGIFLLEVANYTHARNRVRHLLKGKRMPLEPVDIRSVENKRDDEVPFVNHNPKKVSKQLAHAGFKIEKTLSVSNLRSTTLKRYVPKSTMLKAERVMQTTLSRSYFGPSAFFLIKKAK